MFLWELCKVAAQCSNVEWQFVKLCYSFENFWFSFSYEMLIIFLIFGVKVGENNFPMVDSLATDFKK